MVQMPHWPIPPWHKTTHALENIQILLKHLGNPHHHLPPVIHIAGTNGKGSSTAFLTSIFKEAGYKVHCYTSPHLVIFNERIVLNGEKISDDYLFEILEYTRLAAVKANITPSFFEGITAAAFLAFSRILADILILETGIGGRFDATNIVPKPLATIITTISLDHTQYLGPTLIDITKEKAGIIKPGVPCIIGSQLDFISELLINICQEKSATSHAYGYDYSIQKLTDGFLFESADKTIILPPPDLNGDHQYLNAAAAVAAVTFAAKDFNIKDSEIARGLSKVNWPGRIQRIDPIKYPHAGNIQIWLDGAHNAHGAQVLAYWAQQNLTNPFYLIIGMTGGRNIEEFCGYFKDIASGGFAVKVLSEVLSYDPEIIVKSAKNVGLAILPSDSLSSAISMVANASPAPTDVIVCGSLFLVADFLKLFQIY